MIIRELITSYVHPTAVIDGKKFTLYELMDKGWMLTRPLDRSTDDVYCVLTSPDLKTTIEFYVTFKKEI